MLAERGYTLADVIGNASQAEKVFDSLFQPQPEAANVPLPEGHSRGLLHRGQILNVDFIL